MATHALLLLISLLLFQNHIIATVPTPDTGFFESFDTNWKGRWIVSRNSSYKGKWKYQKSSGHDDYGLLVSEKARKYAIAIDLPEPMDPHDGTIVLQYDLRLQKGLDCGGAYLKYLVPQEEGWSPSDFDNETPYSIMFGPDKCGATNKIHFIFRHKNPMNGKYTEHHLKNSPAPTIDKLTHVYTAIIYQNNTLKILIDGEHEEYHRNLLTDFEPPVIPPQTIPNPEEIKPSDWDDRETILDPDATKPENWNETEPRNIIDEKAVKPEGWLDDEPDEIDDPDASQPQDWDEDEDGKWESPKINNPRCGEAPGCGEWSPPTKRNPSYKGKWKAQFIKNPGYKGVWKPQEIPNKEYFKLEKLQLEPIGAIGIEIWTMNDGVLFDNVLVTHDENVAAAFRNSTWKPKRDVEKAKEAIENEEKNIESITKGPSNFKEKFFHNLYKVADIKFLQPYRYEIITAIKRGEDFFALILGIIGTIPLLLFSFYYSMAPSKKRKSMPKMTIKEFGKASIPKFDDLNSPKIREEPIRDTMEDENIKELQHEIEKEDQEEPKFASRRL